MVAFSSFHYTIPVYRPGECFAVACVDVICMRLVAILLGTQSLCSRHVLALPYMLMTYQAFVCIMTV